MGWIAGGAGVDMLVSMRISFRMRNVMDICVTKVAGFMELEVVCKTASFAQNRTTSLYKSCETPPFILLKLARILVRDN